MIFKLSKDSYEFCFSKTRAVRLGVVLLTTKKNLSQPNKN